MNDLLLTLVVLAFLKMLFEEARITSKPLRLLHAIIYGGVTLVAHFVGQHLSLPKVEALLNTPEALRDLALFVMLDLLFIVYTATYFVKQSGRSYNLPQGIPMGTSSPEQIMNLQSQAQKKLLRGIQKIPLFIPPLLFIPILFYIRLRLFYLLPGESFIVVTLILLGVIMLFCYFAPTIVNLFTDIKRRDSLSQISITITFVAFLVVVATGVMHPSSQITAQYQAPVAWRATILFMVLAILGVVIGALLYNLCEKRKHNKTTH